MIIDKNPLISVVICAFSSKRFDMTIDCIHSIFNNTYKNYEILLVVDGNHELKQKMDDKFKDNKNVIVSGNGKNEGPSIARNKGIYDAKGDIIAFIDDDAFAEPDWLERIAKDFSEYPEILVVGGKLLPDYESGVKKLPEEILWIVGGTYKGHPENRQTVRNVFTGNMAVKRDVFNDIMFEVPYNHGKKGFLSPIKQLEDTVFCIRVNDKKQNSVLYDPEIVAYHYVPKERLSLKYIFDRTFSEGILKAKIGKIDVKDNDKVLSYEHGYLIMVLVSIIKNFCTLKIRNAFLLSLTVSCVALGYICCSLQEKYLNIKRRIICKTTELA